MCENLVLGSLVLLPLVGTGAGYLFFVRFQLHRRTGARVLRLVAGNLIVLSVAASLLLLLGEIYYRFVVDTTDAFAASLTTRRWFARHFQVNSAGFRDDLPVYAAGRPQDRRRISFVGDSFTAGHGVPDVGDRFANRIRRTHPEWEVHALAQPGWDTGHHLALMRDAAASGYELDVVVLVTCLNDVVDMIPAWREMVRGLYADESRCPLAEHSYLASTLYHRSQAMRGSGVRRYYDIVASGYEGEIWERQKGRLRRLRDAVTARHGTLLVVLFPFLDTGDEEPRLARAMDALASFWQRLGVPVLDLRPAFAGHDASELTVNRFDPHPNERTHALAAEAIGTFLTAELSSDRP